MTTNNCPKRLLPNPLYIFVADKLVKRVEAEAAEDEKLT